MRFCHLSHRELLQWAAVVSSTSLLPVLDPERAYAAASKASTGAVPMNAELVTLTETSVVVTWYTGVLRTVHGGTAAAAAAVAVGRAARRSAAGDESDHSV